MLILALFLPQLALAEALVWVKARAFVEELSAQPSIGGLTVRGRLRDDLGEPVAGATVELQAGAHRALGQADLRGRFQISIPGAAPTDEVKVRFAGSALLATTEAALNPATTPPPPESLGRLTLTAPSTRPLGEPLSLSVTLSPPKALAVSLLIDGREASVVRTGPTGQAKLQLKGLSAGVLSLEAKALGYAPAQQTVEIVAPLAISLAEAPEVSLEAPLALTGRAAGPASLTVTLLANGREVAHHEGPGNFAFSLAPGPYAGQTLALEARARAGDQTVSAHLALSVPAAPRPLPPWLIALTALGVLGTLALSRLTRRRPRPLAPPPPPPPPVWFEPARQSGPREVTLFAVDDRDGAPLPALLLEGGDPTAPLPPRPLGEPLPIPFPPGPGTLWLGCPGYVPQVIDRPQRGGRLTVRLLTPRAFAQRRFEALLESHALTAHFGRDTPRELLPALAVWRTPALAQALVAQVEAACFGEAPPTDDDLRALATLADAFREEAP